MYPKYEFKFIMRLPSGHRIYETWKRIAEFTLAAMDGIAIADNSGETPDRTEDGVLYLDRSRPLRIDDYSGAQTGCWLPLRYPNGQLTSTVVDSRTVAILAGKYDWDVEIAGTVFIKETE